MMVIARLPNVLILNGGDKIPDNEREDAERAFIRFYMDEEEKPKRYHELVAVHGRLDPLVNFDMQPSYHVKVGFEFSFWLRKVASRSTSRSVAPKKSSKIE